MGGYGSGRRWTGRQTTDSALRLDVRWLVRQGLIGPGAPASAPLRWTTGGKASGQIQVSYDARQPAALALDYGVAGRAVHDVIVLERTPCPYGGERLWCRCPGCDTRRAVLYYGPGGRFRCVRCHGLVYASTRETRAQRLTRRGQKVLTRLSAASTGTSPWGMPPPRPKGMHWRTYIRVLREWQEVRASAMAAQTAELRTLLDATDR